MIIAVDGPAAAGKGTVARALAAHFGYHFLDTGSLYRMVGFVVLRSGADPNDTSAAVQAAKTLDPESVDDNELRTEEIGSAASIVAVNAGVRAALLNFQRSFAQRKPGAVLDGRDIGTVVCPDADVKLYITATAEIRAERRMKELNERGGPYLFNDVLAEIRTRDARDSSRVTAPLVAADDAIIIDTSQMTVEEAVQAAVEVAEKRQSPVVD